MSRTLPSAPEILEQDARFMSAALELARRGLGRVAPNPAVGALIVKDRVVLGRGATAPGGRPHAEVLALKEAGAAATGATLYVTLEPCSHHGQTPPCTDAVVSAGITRVVSALEDPDPRVAGRGHQRLRDAGIAVTTGILHEPALRANLGHFLRVTQGRAMVTLKLAETADGYAAGPAGTPRLMITAEIANARVHMLRALHDAVMIGSGTALADDPLLTVRLPGLEERKPLRIVIDSHLALSPTARLMATAREHPTLVITGEGAAPETAARFTDAGVDVAYVTRGAGGRVGLAAALALLGARGLTRVFCEGGPRLGGSLITQNLADEIILFRSSEALGEAGLPALDPASRALLADVSHYHPGESGRIGADSYVHYERVL